MVVKSHRYENLCKKYDITVAQIDEAIEQINFGSIACEGLVLVALCELLVSGDIKGAPENEF